MKTDFVKILSVVAVCSFFAPMVILLLRKLWQDTFFMMFAGYWAVGGLISITDFIPSLTLRNRQTIGIVYNMLDIPFILLILYYTTTSLIIKKFTWVAFLFFVIIETISIYLKGFTNGALKYTLGTGIALVLIIVIWEIVRFLKKVEHNNRQNAKVFIYAALLFEYGTFVLIYIFDYFVTGAHHNDIYFIYYTSTVMAILIASCGYLLYRKYTREEPLKNEVQINII